MKFNVMEWRRTYNEVQKLGKILKDSYGYTDRNKIYHSPVQSLGEETQKNLNRDIQRLLMKSKRYLDECGMTMPEPLWYYDSDDPKTWSSHSSFKYDNALGGRDEV